MMSLTEDEVPDVEDMELAKQPFVGPSNFEVFLEDSEKPWLHRTKTKKTKAQDRKVTATQTPQKTGGEPRYSQKGK
jgi:hypothetical protein